MPHQCVSCRHTFPDGSKEMLSGCPECGGNKFQFIPGDAADAAGASGGGDAEPDEEAWRPREDNAQADARRTVVSSEDLPSDPEPPATRSPAGDASEDVAAAGDEAESGAPERGGDPPGVEELRTRLNEQFESIKILQPGEYELNLMELYDRDEYIIAIEEDGRYVIDVPSSWRDTDQ